MGMNKKAIFGTVQDVQKPNYYTGLETPTATVTVDNDTREISVDVRVANILGTTPDTAYPGALGALLASNLDSEISRSKDEDEYLNSQIDALQEAANELANQIVQVSQRVPTLVKELKDHAEYLTEQEAKDFYASQEWVTKKINEAMFEGKEDIDLSIYAIKSEVAEELDLLEDRLLKEIPEQVDLEPYAKKEDVYTKDEVNKKIDELDVTSKLSNYYTKAQTEDAIETALKNIDRIVCGSAAELLKQFNT